MVAHPYACAVLDDVLTYVPGLALVALGIALIALRRRWSRFVYENEGWWRAHPLIDKFSWIITWRKVEIIPGEEHARDARRGGLVVGIVFIASGVALTSYNAAFMLSQQSAP